MGGMVHQKSEIGMMDLNQNYHEPPNQKTINVTEACLFLLFIPVIPSSDFYSKMVRLVNNRTIVSRAMELRGPTRR